MTTEQLHAAVSRATGEDIELIAGRGFSLIDSRPPTLDEEWEVLALDWDLLAAEQCGHNRLLSI